MPLIEEKTIFYPTFIFTQVKIVIVGKLIKLIIILARLKIYNSKRNIISDNWF